jgi:hypothetical protein
MREFAALIARLERAFIFHFFWRLDLDCRASLLGRMPRSHV